MTKPDPSFLQDVVAPKIIDAMRAASRALAQAGVRHSVAGGLAVGANGYPRATKDVDFLVDRGRPHRWRLQPVAQRFVIEHDARGFRRRADLVPVVD